MTIDRSLASRLGRFVADYLAEGEAEPTAPLDIIAEPVAIRAGTALVLVRLVDAAPPVLRVFSPLLRSVERSPDLLADLNEINAHLGFLRVFWRDGAVFAAIELLATSVDAATFGHACDAVADLADYYDVRLHERFGGELAYG